MLIGVRNVYTELNKKVGGMEREEVNRTYVTRIDG